MDKVPRLEHDHVMVGVDTHADLHVAVVLSALGERLGGKAFPTTRAGYARLVEWASGFGPIDRIGIEGTGSWGRGLTLFCLSRGLAVRDVDRPDRKTPPPQGQDRPGRCRGRRTGGAGRHRDHVAQDRRWSRGDDPGSAHQPRNRRQGPNPGDEPAACPGRDRAAASWPNSSTAPRPASSSRPPRASTPTRPSTIRLLRPGWRCDRWPAASSTSTPRSTGSRPSATASSTPPPRSWSRSRASATTPRRAC